jgi:hypothetical protein
VPRYDGCICVLFQLSEDGEWTTEVLDYIHKLVVNQRCDIYVVGASMILLVVSQRCDIYMVCASMILALFVDFSILDTRIELQQCLVI